MEAAETRKQQSVMSGDDCFRLTSSFGVPREVLEEWLQDAGLVGDWPRYKELLEEHRQKSRAKPMGLGAR